jgi:hypothetical protein
MTDPSPAEIEARCHLIRDARRARLASGKPWTEADVAAVAEAWADAPLVDEPSPPDPPCVQQRIWEALADGSLTVRQLAARIGTTRSSVGSALSKARWCYALAGWRWSRAASARGSTTATAVARILQERGPSTESEVAEALRVPTYAVRAAIQATPGKFQRTGGSGHWGVRRLSS